MPRKPRDLSGGSSRRGLDRRGDRDLPLPRLAGGAGLSGPTPTTFQPGPDARRTPIADLNAARTRIRGEERQRLELEAALGEGTLPDPDALASGAEPPAAPEPAPTEGEAPKAPRKPRVGVAKSLVRDIARGYLQDPDYLEALAARLATGKAPHMEVLFHHYAYGKPATEVAISGMSKPKRYDLDKLPPDKLQQVLAILGSVERDADAEDKEDDDEEAAPPASKTQPA